MSTYELLRKQYSHEASIHHDRIVTGTVYTPSVIANKMVYLMLRNHIESSGCIRRFSLEEFETFFLECYETRVAKPSKLAQNMFDYFSVLSILDLSCGSGALLIAYLEFIDYLYGSCLEKNQILLKQVLTDRLYGVDIEPKAIASLVDTLNAYSEQKGLNIHHYNLYCVNSLIDELPIIPESIDLVIGNPPYIGEKNNLPWFRPVKETDFGKLYYEGKMDYFYFFIYKGYEFIKPNGSLCYLSSNYFLTADGAKKLRQFVKHKFNMVKYLDFGEERIFPEKKLHACVYVLQKSPQSTVSKYCTSLNLEKQFDISDVFHDDDTMSFIVSDNIQNTLSAMSREQLGPLGMYYEINQGIVSGADAQFVYFNSDIIKLPIALHQYLKPFYKNSDIGHYKVKKPYDRQILYINQTDVCDELIDWLKPYKEKLSKRREVIKGIREWYMLTWPRSEHIFNDEKIVVPQRALSNRFAYVDFPFYASADVYFITAKENAPYSLKTLTQILNADLYKLWLNHKGKRKGDLLELYATPLKNIPLPLLNDTDLVGRTMDTILKECFKLE